MKRPSAFVIAWCGLVVVWLTLAATMFCVAIHFIRKYW